MQTDQVVETGRRQESFLTFRDHRLHRPHPLLSTIPQVDNRSLHHAVSLATPRTRTFRSKHLHAPQPHHPSHRRRGPLSRETTLAY